VSAPEQSPELSFVVPAYNEERAIGATLEAINAAIARLGESCEVIVVDDASTDRTADIARAHGARVVTASNRSIARTRNDGARQASGDYLFFVDADTIVDARVIGAALARLRAGDVGGGAVFRWDDPHRGMGKVLEFGVAYVTRWLRLASGCFVFARRTAFEAVGGFDADLVASEEWALSRALGRVGRFRVLREPVITSGRKLAALRMRDVLLLGLRAGLRGPKSLREREFAHIWYTDPPR
jgi:glycosyltransferase involved in cell wall biosynthesis